MDEVQQLAFVNTIAYLRSQRVGGVLEDADWRSIWDTLYEHYAFLKLPYGLIDKVGVARVSL